MKRVILPAATPSMAVDAARRGQGRGHPIQRGSPATARQIDGRIKQDLAYSPPRSISPSGIELSRTSLDATS